MWWESEKYIVKLLLKNKSIKVSEVIIIVFNLELLKMW